MYVTGFGPFAEADVNPTQVLVESLQEGSAVGLDGVLRRCIVSEVDCIDATSVIETLREGAETVCAEPSTSGAPAAVVFVHLGVFASATSFRVERRAYNEATFRYPDASGRQPRNVPVRPEDGWRRSVLAHDAPGKRGGARAAWQRARLRRVGRRGQIPV